MPDRTDDLAAMRAALADARRAGEGFETAWQTALESVARRAPASVAEKVDRNQALAALESTKLDWRLAYERKPPRPAPYPSRVLLGRKQSRSRSRATAATSAP